MIQASCDINNSFGYFQNREREKLMSNYKHILLTTDFTEGSDVVYQKAVELAKLMDAKVSLLHVIEPLPGYGYGFTDLAEIEIQLAAEAKKQLADLGLMYNIPETHQYTEIGSTKLTIIQKGEAIAADLIVMGTHERYGIDYILGSTASAVIQSAKCDVLTVRIRLD
jgi:universal stress protein A